MNERDYLGHGIDRSMISPELPELFITTILVFVKRRFCVREGSRQHEPRLPVTLPGVLRLHQGQILFSLSPVQSSTQISVPERREWESSKNYLFFVQLHSKSQYNTGP